MSIGLSMMVMHINIMISDARRSCTVDGDVWRMGYGIEPQLLGTEVWAGNGSVGFSQSEFTMLSGRNRM